MHVAEFTDRIRIVPDFQRNAIIIGPQEAVLDLDVAAGHHIHSVSIEDPADHVDAIDRDAIVAELYNRYRPNRVRAISYILSNVLQIREDGLAIIIVTSELWHRFGLQEGELEGMVNIPLTIDEVKVCLYLRESDDAPEMRVSIRSKKGWSANKMAARYFHGGGHEQASGGKLRIPDDIASASEAAKFIEKVEI